MAGFSIPLDPLGSAESGLRATLPELSSAKELLLLLLSPVLILCFLGSPEYPEGRRWHQDNFHGGTHLCC